jgi:diaminopimelate epimerase
MLIETKGGTRQANLVKRGNLNTLIQVSMGRPILEPEAIPVAYEAGKGSRFDIMLGDYPVEISNRILRFSFVSMGNPHAVFFTQEDISGFPLSSIGPKVERHPLFPCGTNFELVNITSDGKCSMRVWERGAGETLACGSGACAVMVAAILKGLSKDKLLIELPGGMAEVSWDRKGEVWLTGPAEVVFTGNWPSKNHPE